MHAMPDSDPSVPTTARILGTLGLAPQAALGLLVVAGDPRFVFAAQSLAFAYAALILSFLGGLWWGLASAMPRPAPAWLWLAAVTPSLVALLSFLPWAFAGTWPAPSLLLLGLAIVATLGVDRHLWRRGIAPPWWMRLRYPLSLGLGAMTAGIGLLAIRP